MAPFIVNHPTLLNNWILSREKALKKIREIRKVEKNKINLFTNSLKNSVRNITSWITKSEYQLKKIKFLLSDVKKTINYLETKFSFDIEYPFNEIYLWLEKDEDFKQQIKYH